MNRPKALNSGVPLADRARVAQGHWNPDNCKQEESTQRPNQDSLTQQFARCPPNDGPQEEWQQEPRDDCEPSIKANRAAIGVVLHRVSSKSEASALGHYQPFFSEVLSG
jgi:hypothetical protein